MFFVLSRAWDKEKFWVPIKSRISDLQIQRSNAQPLSHKDWWAGHITKLYKTYILHADRISNVDSVM